MNSAAIATVPRTTGMSPRAKARMAGVLFPATILTGVFTGQFLVVSGDAAATAAKILSQCQITITALMYDFV